MVLLAKTLTAPPTPAGTVAALNSMKPSMEFEKWRSHKLGLDAELEETEQTNVCGSYGHVNGIALGDGGNAAGAIGDDEIA